MQLQLEVTSISYCDFLETRFKEFETHEGFDKGDSFHLTEDGKMKGIAFIKDPDGYWIEILSPHGIEAIVTG